ncbi:nucleotidyltransferase family protein [Aurantiacibacter odishensis]|uniref:nucleotidyltransferase family protein n=1 Tax=Aurantiacibacter odishensis TaxID=1155476 RepID=UPI000E733522|nr:nucleotidyltransferase family protein [Aurantiacibacter odishensis]
MPARPSHQSAVSQNGSDVELRLLPFLLRTLKGGQETWPFSLEEEISFDALWPVISYHGICLSLADADSFESWPAELAERVREEARLQVLWEASHRDLLARTLELFATAGVDVLVTKGTALAYTVYPDPADRRRGDTDLLIRPEQRQAARHLLAAAGFTRAQSSAMQEDWIFDTKSGFVHSIDLHWQPTSSNALRQIFSVEEAFVRSVPLDRLAKGAKALDPVLLFFNDILNHQLHRISGYIVDDDYMIADDRLVWVYGTNLQARGFSAQEWEDLTTLASTRGMSELSLRALERAQALFDTPVPSEVMATLAKQGGQGAIDRFLFHDDTFERFKSSWERAYNWRARATMLRENLFPSAEFMHRRYPEAQGKPLSLFYARRLANGVIKLCQRRLRGD